jgi:hypothetical protein
VYSVTDPLGTNTGLVARFLSSIDRELELSCLSGEGLESLSLVSGLVSPTCITHGVFSRNEGPSSPDRSARVKMFRL